MPPSSDPAVASYEGSSYRVLAAIGIILIFIISFLLIAILTDRHVDLYDEGLILVGAMRVAEGAIPHRDFYANYGPGQFYVLAGVFKAFGQTVLVERLYDAAVKAGVICLVFAVSLPLMGRYLAAVIAVVCALWVGKLGYAVYPIWPSLFLSFLTVLPLLPIFNGRYSGFPLIASGMCAGAVALFRYDMGALAVSIVSLALVVYGFAEGNWKVVGVIGRTAVLLLPFWGGAALIIFPILTVYLLNGVMSDFVFQILRFPAAHYVQMRSLPFPPIWRTASSIVYFPPLAVVAYIAVELELYTYGDISKSTDPTKWIAFLIAMFAAGLYFKGIVRVSSIHMAPSILFSFVLVGFTIRRLWSERYLPLRPALAVLVLSPVVCAVASSIHAVRVSRGVVLENLSEAARLVRQTEPDAIDPCDQSADLYRARCFFISDAERHAAEFVRSNTTPSQTIFVVDGENDKTFANNNAFYFLAARQPATKWYHFDPGLQSSTVIQDQIISDLERQKPQLIVIDTEFDMVEEPNESAKHSGVIILDDYIRRQYTSVAQMGTYQVLQRQR